MFSLCLFLQRKAAKEFWWLRIVPQTIAIAYLLSLFLFEEEAPKEKALQKENGRIRGAARSTPRQLFEKSWIKTFLSPWFVRTTCALNPNLFEKKYQM